MNSLLSFPAPADIVCVGASRESAVASLPADLASGGLAAVGCAWSDLAEFRLPAGPLHLWIDLAGTGHEHTPPPASLASWLEHPHLEWIALGASGAEDSRVAGWLAALARSGRGISAPGITREGKLLLVARLPEGAAARDPERLAADNNAAWSAWRVEQPTAGLAAARQRIAELEAEQETRRREAWTLERRFRDVEQRYHHLIASERWRLANEIAEALKHPGMRTVRLPWELIRGAGHFAAPRLRRTLRRLAYRWRGVGAGTAAAGPPLLATGWDPAWLELGRRVSPAHVPLADPTAGGVYLLRQRQPEAQRLTPNDWQFHLQPSRRSAVLVRACRGFDDTGWRGALAGLGDPAADGLLRLLATCRRQRIPILFSVCDDETGLGLSTHLAAQCDHLNGETRAVNRLTSAHPALARRRLDGADAAPDAWTEALGWR